MVRKVIDQGENECACGVIYVEVVIVLVFVSMWKVVELSVVSCSYGGNVVGYSEVTNTRSRGKTKVGEGEQVRSGPNRVMTASGRRKAAGQLHYVSNYVNSSNGNHHVTLPLTHSLPYRIWCGAL